MKEKLTNNIVLKIASVLFAIVVWLIVLNINDPEKVVTVSEIPVDIINDDAITSLGKYYSVKSGKTCTIKISGPRSIVDKLDTEDFHAVADIKDLSLTNSVPIEVELKKNTYKSKVDITVETTLKLDIEDIIEKEFEIETVYTGQTEENYVVTGTILEAETVIITAPRSQMDKIRTVVTNIDVSGKNNDFNSTTSIKLMDNYNKEIKPGKEVKISTKVVSGTSTVLYKKSLPVVCDLPATLGYDILISDYTLSMENIEVVGRKELLDTIENIELKTDLSEYDNIEDMLELKYKIDDLLPEGVYNYSAVAELTLSIFIDKQSEKSITTNVKNISISNIPDGLEASFVTKGNITFGIRGLKDLVDGLGNEDIIMMVNVDELSEGIHELKVLFSLPDGIEVIGDVTVEVSLAKKEDSSNDETSETESSKNDATSDNTGESNQTDTEDESDGGEETTTPIGGEETT